MEGHLVMSRKERERMKVFARVKREGLTLKEAAELTALSYRQCRRAYKRQHQEGANRFGRTSDHDLECQGRNSTSQTRSKKHQSSRTTTAVTRTNRSTL